MNIILCALNAKFIHSSLAVNSLMANVSEYKENILIREFTINHSEDFIVSELYRLNPDVIAFSCYIWNIEMIINIVNDLKKALPELKIVLGGPEASYEYDGLFESGADYVIIGEGEAAFRELSEYFLFRKRNMEDIKGIAYKNFDKVVYTGTREPLELDSLPFVYADGFDAFQDRIIYYETTRGCPFNCQYCLSSIEKGIRFLSLSRVEKELNIFLNADIRQVKFADRTFNCNKSHAMGIWKYIIEKDNDITNFHFEIAADLLDDEMIELLKRARSGQIQFEIGVQSTNGITLDNIKRKTDLDKLFRNVQKIKALKNINLHLDLIAGLPGEGYLSFKNSFNDVYNNYPEQLQLGFLKVLKGSGLRENADTYGIVYRSKAPYEALYTNDISFKQMLKLKDIEEMLGLYYNSNKFLYSIRYIVSLFADAFNFFEMISEYWREKEYHLQQHNKMRLYTILYEFCLEKQIKDADIIKELLRFDIFMCDNVKALPYWLEKNAASNNIQAIKDFYMDDGIVYSVLPGYTEYSLKQIRRMCAIQQFEYDIVSWIESGYKAMERKNVFILFDYKSELEIPGIASYHSKYIDITKHISRGGEKYKEGGKG